MRIVRSNPSWAARVTFAVLGAAAFASAVGCLELTVHGIDTFLISRWLQP